MPGAEFKVRIPPFAREAFSGKPRLKRRFMNQAAGEAWVRQVQLDIAKLKAGAEAASVGVETARSVTFKAAVGLWLDRADLRESTRSWYLSIIRAHLLHTFAEVPLFKITRPALLEHLDRRRHEGASASNVGRDVIIMGIVLRWAREQGYSIDEAALKVRAPKTVPTFTRRFDPDAAQRLLDAATDPRDRAVLEVAMLTGMRRGELRAFDASWIRWHEGRIVIPHDETFSPKGRRSRAIPLSDRLASVLHHWLNLRRDGLIFPPLQVRVREGEAEGTDLRRIFRRVNEAAGRPFHGLHDLRHHYVSWLASLGLPAPDLMAITGHRSLAMVQKYLHAAPGALDRARRLLDGAEVGPEVGPGRVLARQQGIALRRARPAR